MKMTGGEKFQAAISELAGKLSKGGKLKVGFLAGATYPSGIPVAAVAAFNEFGVPSHGQPPRPFFRSMITDHKGEWGADFVKIVKGNDYDTDRSLNLLGEEMAGQLRDSITNGSYAPLKPSTVKRKGFDTPLIDSGHLLASIDFEVT